MFEARSFGCSEELLLNITHALGETRAADGFELRFHVGELLAHVGDVALELRAKLFDIFATAANPFSIRVSRLPNRVPTLANPALTISVSWSILSFAIRHQSTTHEAAVYKARTLHPGVRFTSVTDGIATGKIDPEETSGASVRCDAALAERSL